jgi:choice-of-anchor A domain-containing protein
MLIALVLSAIIAGVTVSAMLTSMNVVTATSAEIADSTDATLISTFLVRDAQAAGGTDPATAALSTLVGVAVSGASWGSCQQPGTLVARFSWFDRSSVSNAALVTTTYAFDSTTKQITRRLCQNGTTSDVVIGRAVSAASASCSPDPTCAGLPLAISLTLTGSSSRSTFTSTLTAALRGQAQTAPASTNSSPVPLIVLGSSTSTCPSLSLAGTGAVKVIGDSIVNTNCGTSPIGGDLTRLQPTGVSNTIAGQTDPFSTLAAPANTCANGGSNPTTLGQAATPNTIVTHPAAVTISSTVAFNPGVYVFCQGLTIAAGAKVTGSGVLVQLPAGALTIDSAATIDLSPATSGTYANLLVWSASASKVTLGSTGRASNLRGIVYAPLAQVSITSGLDSGIGGLIAKTVDVNGIGLVRFGLPLPSISISPSSLPASELGLTYVTTALSATGGTAPYTWSATGLPAGLSLSSGGSLSGIPNAAGTSTPVITVTDATGAGASIDLPVTVSPALVLSGPASLSTGQLGLGLVSTTMQATGGVQPYTWSATGLPGGVSINSAGIVSGTPTSAGTATPTITVTDALGVTASKTYALTINAALSIGSPTSLPSGQVGTAYSTTSFSSSGGTIPIAWSATGLPAGLSLSSSGTLTGTPTTAGTSTVTVTATDLLGTTAKATYTLVVAASGAASISLAAMQNFQIMTEGDTRLELWWMPGAIAAGGNFSFTNYGIIAGSEASTFTATGMKSAAGVVVGGYVDLTNSVGGYYALAHGLLHTGSIPKQTLTNWSGIEHLAPTGVTDWWSTPRVVMLPDQTDQKVAPVVVPNAFPFANTFTSLRSTSTTLAALDPKTCSSIATATVGPSNGNYALTLTKGKVNVWTLTIADMTKMNYVVGNLNPDATTPLIINVPDAGAVAVPLRYWTPLQSGLQSAILWNFPNATSVAVDSAFYGSLLAPNAAVKLSSVALNGDVAAKSLQMVNGSGTLAHFSTSIACSTPVSISAATLPSVTAGSSFTSTQLVASGGAAPYTWSATGLPDGITLSLDGVLSGTPTTAGTYTIVATATDANKLAATQSFTLTVGAAKVTTTGTWSFAGSQKFQYLVEGNATLASYSLGGAAAIGGTLTFKNYETVANGEASSFQVNPKEHGAGLIVGGAVDLATTGSGNQLTVSNGFFHVGSSTSQAVLTFGSNVHLVPKGVNDNWSTPRVIVNDDQSNQASFPLVQPNVFPFSDTFTTYRSFSKALTAMTSSSCAAVATPKLTTDGSNWTVNLVVGKVNVWNTTLAEFKGRTYAALPTTPDSRTPLIINITDATDVGISMNSFGAFQKLDPTAVLWNFPSAVTVSVDGTLVGALLAPNSTVSFTGVDMKGDLVAKSFTMTNGSGAVNHFTPSITC